jgi:SAM-dependent methyltransferase
MDARLPSPESIAENYNRVLKSLDGEYIQRRWGDSEIKRRHYRQTLRSVLWALDRAKVVGDVVEVGCGPAVWTTFYLPAARTVRLIDISQEMLLAARKRLEELAPDRAAHVVETCGDFLQIETPRASADLFFSARAFEYMSDKAAFVRKASDLLRPGGAFVLITKNRQWRDLEHERESWKNAPADKVPFEVAMQLGVPTAAEVLEMCRAASLQDVVVVPTVIGSYRRPFQSVPAIRLADVIHGRTYDHDLRALPRWITSFAESFTVFAKKPT